VPGDGAGRDGNHSETWEPLEAPFIRADVGVGTTLNVMGTLRASVRESGLTRAGEQGSALRTELLGRLIPPPKPEWNTKLSVVLIIGFNDSEKTAAIAKLVKFYDGRGVG
jgi:fused signal recognition particle receptor